MIGRVWRTLRMLTAWFICGFLVTSLEWIAAKAAPRGLPMFDELDVFGEYPFKAYTNRRRKK